MPVQTIQLSEDTYDRFNAAAATYMGFEPGTEQHLDRVGIGITPNLIDGETGELYLGFDREAFTVEGETALLFGIIGWIVRGLMNEIGHLDEQAEEMYLRSRSEGMNLPDERVAFYESVNELTETLSNFAKHAATLSSEIPREGGSGVW